MLGAGKNAAVVGRRDVLECEKGGGVLYSILHHLHISFTKQIELGSFYVVLNTGIGHFRLYAETRAWSVPVTASEAYSPSLQAN
jgi:hypothetical protein